MFISLVCWGLWHITHMYIRQTFPNADEEYTGYEKEEDYIFKKIIYFTYERKVLSITLYLLYPDVNQFSMRK